MPLGIKWGTTKEEANLINMIAKRAVAEGSLHGVKLELLDTVMDITACHCNGHRLDLKALLAADKQNFSHDVVGIIQNMDRETGKLKEFFEPRYSEKVPAK